MSKLASDSAKAHSAAEQARPHPVTSLFPSQSRSLTILLVEDNPADLYLIKVSLQAEAPGCSLISVEDGEAAIAYLTEQRPSLVILDWNVPRRSGLEVLTFIRSEDHLVGLPLVIFSSSPKEALEYRAAQADAFIQKPFELECFLQVGKQALQCLAECEGRSAAL